MQPICLARMSSDMYLPGNGILFDDGIHATIGGTGGVTITFTKWKNITLIFCN